MTVSKIAPRPPPPPPKPAPAAPKAAAAPKQAAAAPKDSFKPTPTPAPAPVAPTAAPRASAPSTSAPAAPRNTLASRAPTAPVGPSAPALPPSASSAPGAVPPAGTANQAQNQTPSHFAAVGQTQGQAQATTQGFASGVQGTGNFAPDPGPDFGKTAPGAAPLPQGARPVQEPQPTGVPGVTSDPDDGRIIGAGPTGPTSYPPNTPLDQVQPFTPQGQDPNAPRPTIFFTNGIGNTSTDEARSAQQLANQTGANVIAVHNGTNGFVGDVAQSEGDRQGLPGNAATNTLTNLLTQQAHTGQPVYVAAHSQGAIITSDALRNTESNLRSEGLSKDQVQQVMGHFHVETFGGAASSYPSGPHYTHVIHPGDPVSGPLGMGNPINAARAELHGQDVVVRPNPATVFGDPFQNHTFSGYAPQAVLPP